MCLFSVLSQLVTGCSIIGAEHYSTVRLHIVELKLYKWMEWMFVNYTFVYKKKGGRGTAIMHFNFLWVFRLYNGSLSCFLSNILQMLVHYTLACLCGLQWLPLGCRGWNVFGKTCTSKRVGRSGRTYSFHFRDKVSKLVFFRQNQKIALHPCVQVTEVIAKLLWPCFSKQNVI